MNYFWIMKFLFTKISSQHAWLADEEVSVLGINKFMNLHWEDSRKLHHENLLSGQNGTNHENFRHRNWS